MKLTGNEWKIMQAILTKYLCPTNTRGSRIKASCDRGSLTVSYDSALDFDGNHKMAAEQLCAKFVSEDIKNFTPRYPKYTGKDSTWSRPLVTGTLQNNDYVHVFTK